jgi:hypothetical protein
MAHSKHAIRLTEDYRNCPIVGQERHECAEARGVAAFKRHGKQGALGSGAQQTASARHWHRMDVIAQRQAR